MTAHELARKLLEGPDWAVVTTEFNDETTRDQHFPVAYVITTTVHNPPKGYGLVDGTPVIELA